MGLTGYLLVDRVNNVAMVIDRGKLTQAQREYARVMRRPVAFTICDLALVWERRGELVGSPGQAFTLSQVADIAGIQYRVAHQWLHEGILRGVIKGPSGSGRGREITFSWWGALTAGIMGSLSRNGCGRRALQEAARQLHEPSDKSQAGRNANRAKKRRKRQEALS